MTTRRNFVSLLFGGVLAPTAMVAPAVSKLTQSGVSGMFVQGKKPYSFQAYDVSFFDVSPLNEPTSPAIRTLSLNGPTEVFYGKELVDLFHKGGVL